MKIRKLSSLALPFVLLVIGCANPPPPPATDSGAAPPQQPPAPTNDTPPSPGAATDPTGPAQLTPPPGPGAAYNPCAGKRPGDACTICPPGAADCMETMVIKACDANGQCVARTQ